MGDFDGMVQNILGVTMAEVEPSKDFEDFEMQRRQSGFGDGFFG
jgi:hypothetical protein